MMGKRFVNIGEHVVMEPAWSLWERVLWLITFQLWFSRRQAKLLAAFYNGNMPPAGVRFFFVLPNNRVMEVIDNKGGVRIYDARPVEI